MGGAFYEGVAGTVRQRGNGWQVDTTVKGLRLVGQMTDATMDETRASLFECPPSWPSMLPCVVVFARN